MINTQIRQFKNTIVTTTNASPLPIEVKRLVFLEIQKEIDAEADRRINAEKQQAEKENSDKQKENIMQEEKEDV